ncbi:MAG: alpha-amylase family glycosyl hydrolase [Lachnospiraceae bacterium]
MNTWYTQAVFYHMYPLGMTGAPVQNTDAVIINRFQELEQWIPHIRDLGCNVIYIGPLFESSSHGYDTRDFKLADRRLGTNESFARFTSLCHESGIRVVVDGVFNHTGRDFFAFQDILQHGQASAYCGWYRNLNFGGSSPMGDPFSYDAWQGHFQLPCLNLQNPEVKAWLFDVIQFWISEFDVDGIRLDCANVLDFTFMEEMRTRTAQMKEQFWLMGEVIHGDYSRWANSGMLHSVTNYELHKSLYSGLNDHNFFEIAHNVKRLEAIAPVLYTFLDNHDENRIASKLTDRGHLPLAYLLLMTLPGIPSIYYGSEWGIEGLRSNHSDTALRPHIPVAEMKQSCNSLTDYISQLAAIHTGHPEFHGGRYQELMLTNRQYAYARHAEGSAVLVAANNDSQAATISIPIPIQAQHVYSLTDDTVIPVQDGRLTLTLPANAGMILKMGGITDG